ncbi:MAG: PA1136 family autoinducer-binding transcriptional regulator [Alishewanella aestuarii]
MLQDKLMPTLLAVERSKHFSELQQYVRNFVGPFGYDRILSFTVNSSLEGRVERIYWLEGAWLEQGQQIDVTTYLRHCPATQHVIRHDEPFFWSKISAANGERYKIVNKPQGQGLHGLQIPIFGATGLQGAFSFAGKKIDASSSSRLALTSLANVAFFRARNLLEAPATATKGQLTAREQEILAWIGAGWRQAAIAETLGISTRTIENHLRNARLKLGAATTAEAIRINKM